MRLSQSCYVGALRSRIMRLPKPGLTAWIFIGMAAGVLLGYVSPEVGVALRPIAQIFLRLIKSIIAPLIFATLVVGIAGAGSFRQIGRLGLKSIIYFEVVTTLALVIGLVAVNLLQPGSGIRLEAESHASEVLTEKHTAAEVILHIFPTSVVDAAARGDVLQIVIFAILFAAGVSAAGERAAPVLRFCESLAEVMFKFTGYVMKLAPFGVGAAIAAVVGSRGFSVLVTLGKAILTFYVALIFFVVFVLGGVCWLARVPIRKFLRAVEEPMLIAFSTTSSEAALPKAMEAMEQLGVPRRIVSFVIPTGYSFNLDGSTLYLSMAAIFVAQAAGVHLSVGQQVMMMLTLMLTSKGVAGVSRASLVILAGALASFHLPLEGVAVLLGIDQIMDMARTAVNVLGNCLASVVIARWEGEFPATAPASTVPAAAR